MCESLDQSLWNLDTDVVGSNPALKIQSTPAPRKRTLTVGAHVVRVGATQLDRADHFGQPR
jgi:hypothetical protein